MLLLRIASLVPTYILEDMKTNDVFQVFHYVGYFTEGAVDVVGYLQIPTFFLLSGFCLSLGSFLNFSFDHPFCHQDMDRHLNLGGCPTSTLRASPDSTPSTSLLISSHSLPSNSPQFQY